jgi:hypothetical protein
MLTLPMIALVTALASALTTLVFLGSARGDGGRRGSRRT